MSIASSQTADRLLERAFLTEWGDLSFLGSLENDFEMFESEISEMFRNDLQ